MSSCIMNHFIVTNLFSCKQFGFIRGSSTFMQLLKVLELCTKLQLTNDPVCLKHDGTDGPGGTDKHGVIDRAHARSILRK